MAGTTDLLHALAGFLVREAERQEELGASIAAVLAGGEAADGADLVTSAQMLDRTRQNLEAVAWLLGALGDGRDPRSAAAEVTLQDLRDWLDGQGGSSKGEVELF